MGKSSGPIRNKVKAGISSEIERVYSRPSDLISLIREANAGKFKGLEVVLKPPYDEKKHGGLPETIKEVLKTSKILRYRIDELVEYVTDGPKTEDVLSRKWLKNTPK